MKITIFTPNHTRHNYLCNQLSEIADEIFIIQEVETLLVGKKLSEYKKKSNYLFNHYKKIEKTEKKFFGESFLNFSKKKVKIITMRHEDISFLKKDKIKDFLKSDYYIIFGCSFIKGSLADFLLKKKAINIHMGISPYYRGADCNFWAVYDKNPSLVGATIQLLSKKLDDGLILYHATSDFHKDPFVYTMASVKSAILSLKKYIKFGKVEKPISIKNKKEIRLSRRRDITDKILKKYSKIIIKKSDHTKIDLVRQFNLKLKNFY